MNIRSIFLLLFLSCNLFSKIERLKLEEVSVYPDLKRVRGNRDVLHQWSHVVYQDEKYYYKIWPPNLKREKLFLAAYRGKLFHEITPLNALIFDKENNLRGYCTKKCEDLEKNTDYIPNLVQKEKRWADFQEQPAQFQELILKIREKFTTTRYFFFDLVPHNFGIYRGKYVIFDLDSIIHANQLTPTIIRRSKGSQLFYTPEQLKPFGK